MRGPTSGFLDRVHRDASIDDRSRLASVPGALAERLPSGDREAVRRKLPEELSGLGSRTTR